MYTNLQDENENIRDAYWTPWKTPGQKAPSPMHRPSTVLILMGVATRTGRIGKDTGYWILDIGTQIRAN